MSWVTIVWSMVASACLTLAAMHLRVWSGRRTAWAHLLFSLSAAGVAAYAGCELWMMRAETPGEFGLALRWAHVPVWVTIVSLVAFARLYLRAGRLWLAWTVCGLRTLSLLINCFGSGPNVNYREISALRRFSFLGESVSAGEGVRNPWTVVGQLSLLLLVLFVTDASVAAWRRGDRRQALVVGGSIAFFALGGTLEAVLVLGGIVHAPLTASLFYLGLIAAMGYQLSDDVLRAARLSDELREREQQMTLAEERFRLVVEASPSGIVLMNGEGRVVLVNAETERLFGYTREELTGKSVEMLVPERFRGDHPGHRAGYLAAPRARPMGLGREVSARRKDGTEFTAEIGLSPVPREDGPLVLAAIVDVTARRQDEAEVLRLRADLAHAGRVSTMAQLASGLAHELNQPLGAILRNAEAAELLLQRSPPDLEEVRAILADICRDDHRAGEVIDRMRALLKRRGLERVELNSRSWWTRSWSWCSRTRRAARCGWAWRSQKALPPVRGDRVHLQQVLLNLILNGMDAMAEVPAERRRLVVRARQADAGTIEVAIADAGHGVAAAKLARLFEPFFTTKPDGLGLGLPISATIIGAHGGRIWADSGPAGATFYFTVPVNPEE